jgi:molybdopterin converting factor small subunit
MRIRLHLMALPALARAMGGKKHEVDLPGETVADLVEYLVREHGPGAREALLDEEGRLDPIIQILLNEKEWVVHDDLDVPLHEGDSVILMLLVAGG